MAETSRTPTLGQMVNFAIQRHLRNVHTSIIVAVTRYDESRQLADVKPLIQQADEDEEGNRVLASIPVLTNCPVLFPTGGGRTIMFPISVGDTGLLVISQASLDKWLSGTGGEVDPEFDHRHQISDGVFLPGVLPFGKPRQTTTGGTVCIGTDGGPFFGAALGAAVRSKIAELITCVNSKAGGIACAPLTDPLHDFESQTVRISP